MGDAYRAGRAAVLMGRVILQLVSALCLFVLVFTDLDLTQRLLLTGVIVPTAIVVWWEHLNGKT